MVVAADAATPARPVSFRRDWVLWFRMLGAGEYLQVRNAAERPLVLLQVTLSADPSGPAAGATPTA